MAELLILGLDPGSQVTGYGLLERSGGKLRIVDCGVLSIARSEPLARRLAHLADEVERLLSTHRPTAAVVEKSFHGVNARSLIVLAEARGAILACLGRHPIEIAEYSPAEVKAAVTGNGRADKVQVARMVQLLLGLTGKPPRHDTTDALALALCFSQRAALDRLAALPR